MNKSKHELDNDLVPHRESIQGLGRNLRREQKRSPLSVLAGETASFAFGN